MTTAHAHDHDHPPHLAHHFETPEQQMESGKLGMWVFLATEILMFGGLFCAYAVYRSNNPDVYLFAHQVLDTNWGAINTAVLLASSFTMAWGVRAAQLGQKTLLVTLLILTMLGGMGFMAIKTVEYESKFKKKLFAGDNNAFFMPDGRLADPYEAKKAAEYVSHHGDSHGAGHGKDAHGGAHDGKAGHGGGVDGHSTSNSGKDATATGAPEAAGGTAAADGHGDGHADDAAPVTHASGNAEAGSAGADTHDEHAVAVAGPPATEAPAAVGASGIARPAAAPSGLVPVVLTEGAPQLSPGETLFTGPGAALAAAAHEGSHYPTFEELPPLQAPRVYTFFQIYFAMTGLHGLHVMIGLGLIAWITFRAGGPLTRAFLLPGVLVVTGLYFCFFAWLTGGYGAAVWGSALGLAALLMLGGIAWAALNSTRMNRDAEGEFGPGYYTPVDCVGLYWHLVDLIWIFLFPLLYLIH